MREEQHCCSHSHHCLALLLFPVRPKLNVKPSVVKPKAHVKPGQKRKAAERSAVAAVKPLNSAATGREEPLQTSTTTTCRSRQVGAAGSVGSATGFCLLTFTVDIVVVLELE